MELPDITEQYVEAADEEQTVTRSETTITDEDGNLVGMAVRITREDPRDTSLEIQTIDEDLLQSRTYVDRRRDGTNHQVESVIIDASGTYTLRESENSSKTLSSQHLWTDGENENSITTTVEKAESVVFEQQVKSGDSVDKVKVVLDKGKLLSAIQGDEETSIAFETTTDGGKVSLSVFAKDEDGISTTKSTLTLDKNGGITIESRDGTNPYAKLSLNNGSFSVIMPTGVRITTDEESVFIVSGSSKIAVDKDGGIILENGAMLSLDKTFGLLSAPAVEVSAGAMNLTTEKLSFGDTSSPVKYKVPKYESLYQKLRMLTLDLENLKTAFANHVHPAPNGVTGKTVPPPPSTVKSQDFDSRRSESTDAFNTLEGT